MAASTASPTVGDGAGLEARAFWALGGGQGELRSTVVGPPGPSEVLVVATHSGVSRGTESLVFRGEVPESEHARMRCPHQEGSFRFPIKYGYASVGRVVAGVGVGRRVFCLHPHQTAYCVDAEAVTELPPDLPSGRAVLAANMETAITGAWDGEVSVGDRVCIVGAGVVGCLLASVLSRTAGAEVQLVDTDPSKGPIAKQLGAAFAAPEGCWRDVDVAYNTSGSGEGLQLAIDHAGQAARVVEMSWYGTRPSTLTLGGSFHAGRLEVRSSQVGQIPPARSPRWSHRRRMTLALELLRDRRFDCLFSGDSHFDELPNVMRALSDAPAGTLCHRINYEEVS